MQHFVCRGVVVVCVKGITVNEWLIIDHASNETGSYL